MAAVSRTLFRAVAASSSRLLAPRAAPAAVARFAPFAFTRYTSSSSSSSSSSSTPASSAPSTPDSTSHALPAPDAPVPPTPAGPQKLAQIEPRLAMTFTCTHDGCGHRSTHEFARKSYEKGVVIVQCPGCKARHLIADHLGWFKEVTDGGKLRTVEDLVREKGEKVTKGRVTMDGDIEYAP
ncbi:hypothetical protein Q8F55_008028 [Vanrija albida]|uniref:DNL-type domain-containing protein n=1 Tax=Vanrija albida TaxID=181172 RepID=A0ABR3PV59_9TREE